MKNPIEALSNKFTQATLNAYPQLAKEENWHIEVVPSTQEKFGHYQCNSSMKLSKMLQLNPRNIAENIIANINDKDTCQNGNMIAELSIAGPGFINITLDPSFLSYYVNNMLVSPRLGIEKPLKPQRILIDFSSPNVAKEMHVGHLRTTIIGDCLARLFEFLGHEVLRINHIGDWGTAFGMLIAYMKDQAPQILQGKETTNVTHLLAFYKASKQRFDADPDFKKRAQLEVVALQAGDKEALKAWETICAVSRKAFQEIYDLLDINIQEKGESFYNPFLPDLIKDLESKGLITISDGAKCIFLEGFQNRSGENLPLMIQKSDGGYNYDTTDMAAIRYRISEQKADRIIYVIDAGQSQHMQMIFKAAEKAGYLNPLKTRVDHVAFGLVLGPDGKKFRTRSGETERLIDLLNTAVDQAKKILEERSPEMPLEERKHLASVLGIGAVKYADLSCHRVGDYVFSYERMLRFEGNTAAFILYSYVRTAGIKRKVNVNIEDILSTHKIDLKHPSEIALGMHIAQFSETLAQIAQDLLPNHLTNYLYTLAEKFNAFFRDCRVEGVPEQNSRLLLCEAVARVLKQGLEILGLKTVERM